MQFDFRVHADNNQELHDALLSLAGAVQAADPFKTGSKGFSLRARPDTWGGWGELQIGDPTTADTTPAPVSKPAKRKSKSVVSPVNDDASIILAKDEDGLDEPDVIADDEPEAEVSPSQVDPGRDYDAGPTAAEAKSRALEILRECYARDGGDKLVGALQKRYGGGKFVSVPEEQAFELLDEAELIVRTLDSVDLASAQAAAA